MHFLVFGEPLDNAVEQMERVQAAGAERCVLMADHHLGYSQPIGGVVAYRGAISPSGVGFDIGCGNKAIRLDVRYEDLAPGDMAKIMDRVVERVPFGVGQTNPNAPDLGALEDHDAWNIPFVSKLKDLAARQLGTVGSGNHYVDVFYDNEGWMWVGCHFGSRGLGHKIATEYVKRAGGVDSIDAEPALLDLGTEDGVEYLMAMQLAGAYAKAGRDWVCDEVARIISETVIVDGKVLEEVHNHHNYAWLEEHFGERLWVVRKGATPAFPGQRGFVGATMTEPSVILKGIDGELSRKALYSTVHGAGRVMSRTQAAGKYKWRRVEEGKRKQRVKVRDGEISRTELLGNIAAAGVELRGGGCDEAPRAYKRLNDVLAAHKGTIEIERWLVPVGVAMAGDDVFDPYKD